MPYGGRAAPTPPLLPASSPAWPPLLDPPLLAPPLLAPPLLAPPLLAPPLLAPPLLVPPLPSLSSLPQPDALTPTASVAPNVKSASRRNRVDGSTWGGV